MHPLEKRITIHQCLHGYSDGHQLLHASTKLSAKADQLLLTMSDMSGPSMVTGFQCYLTGYPVVGSNFYAYAQTWYAGEKRRPGCVWTQTLLVDNSDLARIMDLRLLMKCFVRPSQEDEQVGYSSPIELDLNLPSESNGQPPFIGLISEVLEGLYKEAEKPVYLLADRSDEYADLVLQIWNQQYSKLRRSFMFCTGSLANRKVRGRPLDLQVIPSTMARQIRREVSNGVFIDPKIVELKGEAPRWLRTAVNDLYSSKKGDVRPFLMLFGADAPEGRGAFRKLLEMYTQIAHVKVREAPLEELIGVIAEQYPDAKQGSLLKQMLLGKSPSKQQFLPIFPEEVLLKELAITTHYAAFDAEALKLRERAKELVSLETNRFGELIIDLLNYELNPLGETIIAGISEGIKPADIFDLAAKRYELLFVFLKNNPLLFSSPHIWQVSRDRQKELYDLLYPKLNIGELDIQDVVGAMLEAGSDVLAQEVIRHQGTRAVKAVLDWLDSSDGNFVSESWEWALSYRPDDLLRWLKAAPQPRISTLAFLAGLLDPHAAQVIAFGTSKWLGLSKTELQELEIPRRVRALAFLLALSFNNPDMHSAEVGAGVFQVVHDAAAHDDLPYASWRLLSYQAPSLSWWGEWDKCKRLRHALLNHFMRYNWNPQLFLQAFRRIETFKQILVTYTKKSKEGKYLDWLAREVEKGSIAASKEQRNALLNGL